MSGEILIQLSDVSLWRRTQEEFAYNFKETFFNWLRRGADRSARKQVLSNISLEIFRGETVGIVGANGAGKSTLLKVISGILEPQKGQVNVRGNIAPLIELGAGFDPELSIEDNIYMYGIMLGFSRRYLKAKIPSILEFAELKDYRYRPVKSLSSGMTARLGFAIATDVSPDILILDEVLSVGDAHFKQKCQTRMEGFLNGQTTVLVVSHDLQFIVRECSRAVWIEQGRIREVGPGKEIVDRYLESLGISPEKIKPEEWDQPTFAKTEVGSENLRVGYEVMSITSEEQERIEACIQEIAEILHRNSPQGELNNLEGIERTVRQQMLAQVSPKVAPFLSAVKQSQHKDEDAP
jgi:lipopolysaccharide transport system ATP-binding protein